MVQKLTKAKKTTKWLKNVMLLLSTVNLYSSVLPNAFGGIILSRAFCSADTKARGKRSESDARVPLRVGTTHLRDNSRRRARTTMEAKVRAQTRLVNGFT